jgi:hypothetical protein
MDMIAKFAVVVIMSPIFLFPGVGVALLGAWCGQVYMRAQLCVKREMSNARSPVLGHFGGAFHGFIVIEETELNLVQLRLLALYLSVHIALKKPSGKR